MTDATDTPAPYAPKNGIIIPPPLEVNEEIQPMVFLVELLQGATFVEAFAFLRRKPILAANQKPVPGLGVILVYQADLDEATAQPEPRQIVLLGPGQWVAGIKIVGAVRSLVDGMVYGIGELAAVPEQLERWREMVAARDATVKREAESVKAAQDDVGVTPSTERGDVVDFLAKMRERRGTPENG